MSVATPPAATEPPTDAAAPTPWYQRRAVLVSAAVVVVLAIAVVTDLPTPASPATNAAAASAFVKEVNEDLAPCAYALTESFQFRQELDADQLLPSERAQLPGLFNDDEVACSYAGSSIDDLTSLESPGTPANTQLGDMLASATTWATVDGLRAIDAIQELSTRPTDGKDLRTLATSTRSLGSDRRSALAAVAAAERVLGRKILGLTLPTEPPGPLQ